jgi:hypothetical protein
LSGFSFEAPKEGYKKSYSYKMNAKDRAWFDNAIHVFAFKCRSGQIYGKIVISVSMNRSESDPITIHISGVVNANGSRNLEESEK